MDKDFVILRHVRRGGLEGKPGDEFTPWPIAVWHLGFSIGHMALPDRKAVSTSYCLDVELVRCETREQAEEMIPPLDASTPVCRHTVARLSELRFDVAIHDHYDATTHVQCEGAPWEQALTMYLACQGLVALNNGMFFAAEFGVTSDEHRADYWKKRVDEINIAAGRLNRKR
ncbi:MAG: hypothetical protein WC683_16135 [bacterium]